MEDKSRQELEDLLIEARKESVQTKMTRFNLRLILFIVVFALANVIMFPYDYATDRPDDPDGFFVGMTIQLFIIPICCLPLSLIVGIFRFAPWKFGNRFYRAFLLSVFMLCALLSLVLMLSLAGIIP